MAAPFQGAGSFRLHYPDGRDPEVVKITGRALIDAERRWPGISTDGSDKYRPNEGVYYMVWSAAGRPYNDFEKWLDDGVTLEVVPDDEPVPTGPVAGAD